MSENAKPCAAPEARQFDFWIGEWEASWGDDGEGKNTITSMLGGCVILENFDGSPSTPLRGMSVSTFDARAGKWKQTWVDNQGGYLDFAGEFADGKMILQRQATVDGQAFQQRMVWHNIAEKEFDWNWERSDDGGQTWKVLWAIHYMRRKSR
jgi:hypothetical protein